jgi:hypothetical protein
VINYLSKSCRSATTNVGSRRRSEHGAGCQSFAGSRSLPRARRQYGRSLGFRQSFSARLAQAASAARRASGFDPANRLTGPPDWWAHQDGRSHTASGEQRQLDRRRFPSFDRGRYPLHRAGVRQRARSHSGFSHVFHRRHETWQHAARMGDEVAVCLKTATCHHRHMRCNHIH